MIEDDFSLIASGGCFCEKHLGEFSNRIGHKYSREELINALSHYDNDSIELIRQWQTLKKDSLVFLAEKIREAVDKKCNHIPIGLMQSGGADNDGDCTEAVSRALAGKNHTPFVRLFGTFYCGFNTKKLPSTMYHSL